jgi:hypothetical protein
MDKQVLFVMCSGLVTEFPARNLMHRTTQHGHGGVWDGCCHASADHKHSHISVAVQTPYQTLHKINKFPEKTQMEIVQCRKDDIDSMNWVNAEIIVFQHCKSKSSI